MELAYDDKRMECLKTFSECQDVVTWIRQITKGLVFYELKKKYFFSLCVLFFTGVGDLQNFVSVALATAEDALAQGKLSHLRTVGSGFGSLIYDLKKMSGFKELIAACKSLWVALDKSEKKLPKLLVG